MGRDVTQAAFSCEDRARYRGKARRCLDVFALMLNDSRFDDGDPTTGLEIELDLVDGESRPAMANTEILADLADPTFHAELGQFNLEINISPRLIAGDGFEHYEREILESLRRVDKSAGRFGAQIALIGVLPTLGQEHTVLGNLSPNPRFKVLNDEMAAARGDRFDLDIRGDEQLRASNDTIAAEAACTSTQLHLRVLPETFADYWNASQVIAAIQVAVGANSPFFYGKRLWHETRIPLFLQSTDTRPPETKAQGVRPRVWFGERWIASAFDLFEENVRYFPPLLPICEPEDPDNAFTAGRIPSLGELRLHNGTIYRWNRPVYDITDNRAHLRIENRVLSSGPTVVDTLANAAFYFGLVRALAESEPALWSRMPFSVAEANFCGAARDGIGARVWWPGRGETPVVDLVLDRLLPLAYAGLDRFGVDQAIRDRLLGIIEARCRARRNGALWQAETVQMLETTHSLGRPAALRLMVDRYREGLYRNEPVHGWRLT
ncbi:MAG: glutamate--cysteine ligase [Dactylosporangium sp.]|nr:glutamate--cysteine ligase [Dactylosporangium sp.]NNJ61600.1 glutamate--cysteine ligase [Dactylosporangium sp.]